MTDVAGIAPAPVASGGGFIKLFDNRQAVLRWVIASVLGVGCLLSWFLFTRATFLYDPPLMASTLILWLGPLLVIVIGAATVVVRSRRAPAATKRMNNALSEEERRRLAELLKEEEKQ